MLSRVKSRIEKALYSLAQQLPPWPNMYTILALIIAGFIPVAAIFLKFRLACMVMIILTAASALLDMVDGLVARVHGRTTRRGAFLDSTCDRVVDFLVILGLYLLINDSLSRILLLALLFLSNLISYARARAESLGVTTMAGTGLMERPERLLAEIVLMILIVVLKSDLVIPVMQVYLTAMLILTLITAVHRCIVAIKALRH